MLRQHKDLLRTLVLDLRHLLDGSWDDAGRFQRGDLDRVLEQLGFAPDGAITLLDVLPNPTPELVRAYHVAAAQLAGLPARSGPPGAAPWSNGPPTRGLNRLLALRTLEARGLFPENLRPNPAYDGLAEALFILRHMEPAWQAGATRAAGRAERPQPGGGSPEPA